MKQFRLIQNINLSKSGLLCLNSSSANNHTYNLRMLQWNSIWLTTNVHIYKNLLNSFFLYVFKMIEKCIHKMSVFYSIEVDRNKICLYEIHDFVFFCAVVSYELLQYQLKLFLSTFVVLQGKVLRHPPSQYLLFWD